MARKYSESMYVLLIVLESDGWAQHAAKTITLPSLGSGCRVGGIVRANSTEFELTECDSTI